MKWHVFKRDGAWQVRDHHGQLRYAASDWRPAYSFAVLSADEQVVKDVVRFVWDHPLPDWWNRFFQ